MDTSIGQYVTTTVFGQSHAQAIGATVVGLPVGETIDRDVLQAFMARRQPGGALSTQRQEADVVQIVCGLNEADQTCGAPLTLLIANQDARSKDYRALLDTPRPSHADYPQLVKYRGYGDYRGGGAFSGRLTAPLCAAGGIALQLLAKRGIAVAAHVLSLGDIADRAMDPMGEKADVLAMRLTRVVPTLTDDAASRMAQATQQVRKAGDSLGGQIECMVQGLPVGLGGPLFEGVDGALARALFGVPGVKGIEFGDGFAATHLLGSQHNDPYGLDEKAPLGMRVATNHAGGVVGGMTTGAPLIFRVAIKPTPSIVKTQYSVKRSTHTVEPMQVTGRHDPAIVFRAVPVVEAMAALVILDFLCSPPAFLALSEKVS